MKGNLKRPLRVNEANAPVDSIEVVDRRDIENLREELHRDMWNAHRDFSEYADRRITELENKIKTLLKDNYTYFELLKNLKSKRYTEARLRRILLCSMLNIEKSFVLECLNSDLYLKVLAVNGKKIKPL